MRLEIETSGVEHQVSRLLRLAHRIAGPQPAFRLVATDLRARERRRFASRGDGSWPALRPNTIKQKGSARILVMTGALERSLTARGPGSVERIAHDSMTFGTSLHYARFVAKRRPLFDMTRRDGKQAASRFAQWLMEAVE